ncbi:MAG TPA: Flp family type IVb pilin [Dehalococcoidia bacterium]|nr:Flp family type IVb pilin [Dehalococcoidia bacterium]
MTNLFYSLISKLQGQKGQGLVEYALIIALVSVVLVAALGFLADDIEAVFTDIGDTMAGGAPA